MTALTHHAPGRDRRSSFESIRNAALLTLLADTGLRASEARLLLLDDVNLSARQALVRAERSKSRYDRVVTFGFQTARRLGRYIAERESHPYSYLPELIVGRCGVLTYKALWDLVNRAGTVASVDGARAHLFRHTWASDLKSQGVDMEVLMSLGGWTKPEMVMRYGRAEKAARAVEAYRRVGSPVDRATTSRERT